MADYFPVDMTVGASKGKGKGRAKKGAGVAACPIPGMESYAFTGGKFVPGKRIVASCGVSRDGGADLDKLAGLLQKAGIRSEKGTASFKRRLADGSIVEQEYPVLRVQRPDGVMVKINPYSVPRWVKQIIAKGKKSTMSRRDFERRLAHFGTGKSGGKRKTTSGREVGQTDDENKGWSTAWVIGSLLAGGVAGVAFDHFVLKKMK